MLMPFVRGFAGRGLLTGVAAAGLLGVSACGHVPFTGNGSGKVANPNNAAAIGVNGYLWRATLDTLSFMPLSSADPYGGVIITDWYSNPRAPNERFKCTVYILDSRLRADGLNVAVFKQVKDASGAWVDAPHATTTETQIEDAILDQARKLRLSNIKG
jgi:hypothetical protein